MLRIIGAALAASLAIAMQASVRRRWLRMRRRRSRSARCTRPLGATPRSRCRSTVQLKLWVEQKNAEGGVFVKAFDKKIPIKLVSYDDQSNTATASTLYNQLITQDKVDLLVADPGSVLTAPAVAIARDHKMFLFDQTGTGASFFSRTIPTSR